MLTIAELSDACAELRSARLTIEALRVLFLSGGHSADARRLNDAVGMIAEEIAVLDSAIGNAELATNQNRPSQ
jgi:hypothetical protein